MGFVWTDIAALPDRHPEIFVGFCFAWVFGIMGLSAVIRLQRGKPIFARVPADAIFTEKWTSGRSLRNLVGRFGGARNALLVAVTPTRLIVRPHFPFTLVFLPEIYGLEVEIAPSQLRGAEERQGVLLKRIVIEYALPGRGDEEMELRLRNPAGFLAAIETFRARRSAR
jgi:hypothetical protein